ncbi:hypothetical protein Tco_1352914, partial [Tanacetum coccineum]
MLLIQAQENGVALDEEQLLFIAGGKDNVVDENVDEQPVQDLALNVDNVFQADDCDAFDSDVDEAPTAQTMFMANLSSADPVYDEASPSYDSDILSEALTKEVKEMKEIFEELEVEVDQHVVDRKHDEIERKNLLIENDNLIVDCLFKDVFHVATNSKLNVSSFTEMHDAHTRLKLKYQNLKESFGNNTSPPTQDVPDFDSVFITQLTKKLNVLQEQNELFGAENGKIKQHYKELYDSIKITRAKYIEQTTAIKQHYKELYDSIKITRAKHIEQTTALLTENENL